MVGHADAQGKADDNEALALERARSVWWEQSWSTTGGTLAPIAVLLGVSSPSALYLTTYPPRGRPGATGPS